MHVYLKWDLNLFARNSVALVTRIIVRTYYDENLRFIFKGSAKTMEGESTFLLQRKCLKIANCSFVQILMPDHPDLRQLSNLYVTVVPSNHANFQPTHANNNLIVHCSYISFNFTPRVKRLA